MIFACVWTFLCVCVGGGRGGLTHLALTWSTACMHVPLMSSVGFRWFIV